MEVTALNNISLRAGEGDRLGLIGDNGAGKSTLLKTIAGIYTPTSGERNVTGRISSLFDLTLGFEPEATGWENIAFRGYLQGETPRSIRSKLTEIGEFSQLGEFLDLPLRCYSDGMRLRLAFSIATAIDPELLLLDEALSAGDLSFQESARVRIDQLIAKSRLLVVVSHDMDSILKLCNRVIWLERGRVRQTGSPEEVVAAYESSCEHRPTSSAA